MCLQEMVVPTNMPELGSHLRRHDALKVYLIDEPGMDDREPRLSKTNNRVASLKALVT